MPVLTKKGGTANFFLYCLNELIDRDRSSWIEHDYFKSIYSSYNYNILAWMHRIGIVVNMSMCDGSIYWYYA